MDGSDTRGALRDDRPGYAQQVFHGTGTRSSAAVGSPVEGDATREERLSDTLQRSITLEDTCRAFGVTRRALLGRSRQFDVVLARHAYAYLLRYGHGDTLMAIGKTLARDHTTVRSSIARIDALAGQIPGLSDKILTLLYCCRQRNPL